MLEACEAETRYGASDFFQRDRREELFSLAAGPQGVGGFDSPDLAAVWGIGRFTQTDPLLEERPYSHYAYAGNRPTVGRDPSGLILEVDGKAISKAEDFYAMHAPPREGNTVYPDILETMIKSAHTYKRTKDELITEIRVRTLVVLAAKKLIESAEFSLRGNTPASVDDKAVPSWRVRREAITDIQATNPSQAALDLVGHAGSFEFDCYSAATAAFFYGQIGRFNDWGAFNRQFQGLALGGESNTQALKSGLASKPEFPEDLLPGDLVMFSNLQAANSSWQHEFAIFTGREGYAAHGPWQKLLQEDVIISHLNGLDRLPDLEALKKKNPSVRFDAYRDPAVHLAPRTK